MNATHTTVEQVNQELNGFVSLVADSADSIMAMINEELASVSDLDVPVLEAVKRWDRAMSIKLGLFYGVVL